MADGVFLKSRQETEERKKAENISQWGCVYFHWVKVYTY